MDSMKDSGITWIGEIPEEWSLSRLKDVLKINNGREIENDEGSIPVYGSGGAFKLTNKALCEEPALLFGRKGTIDNPLLVNEPFWTVDTMFYSTPKVPLELRFIYYCATCFTYDYYQSGSTLPSMTQSDLGAMLIPFPPVAQQCSIADFLDQKRAAIDAAADTLETQIFTLERYRASVIHEAVTRGLDPTAPTKPSNVDWIGNIPQGWKCKRVKDVMKINNGREIVKDDGPIPVYGSGGAFKWTDKALCLTSSLLFGRKGTVDKPLLVDGPFWTVDTMFYSVPKVQVDLRFVYYCATCFDYNYYQTGSTLPSMTQSDLGSILMPFPNHDIQKSIADYLDARTAAIDAVIATKRKQLDVLKRRRHSLIYEYVTGKRRIGKEG